VPSCLLPGLRAQRIASDGIVDAPTWRFRLADCPAWVVGSLGLCPIFLALCRAARKLDICQTSGRKLPFEKVFLFREQNDSGKNWIRRHRTSTFSSYTNRSLQTCRTCDGAAGPLKSLPTHPTGGAAKTTLIRMPVCACPCQGSYWYQNP
jgi:hypothetical protein